MPGEHTPVYWKSLPQPPGSAAAPAPRTDSGKPAAAAPGFSRRRFLEAAGFSLTLGGLSGCSRAPVEIALPLVEQPEGRIPGRSLHFATTCRGCTAACGLLATVRDGRPLKMEGLPEHPGSRGGLCAVGQALPMGLYDRQRLRQPLLDGKASVWGAVDERIVAALAKCRTEGGAVRVVTNTLASPTLQAAIAAFVGGFADARHVVWDSHSSSAILDAHEQTHGVRSLPRYRFEQAQVIVSLGADFLGTWISPVEFTAGWKTRRRPTVERPEMSWHAQLEGRMSLSGGKADHRVRVSPADYGAVLSRLYVELASRAGTPVAASAAQPASSVLPDAFQHELADRLWRARGSALVISDSQDVRVQKLVNGVNQLLDGYGKTLDLQRPSRQRQGSDTALRELLAELQTGKVQVLVACGLDLVHSLPNSQELTAAIRKVPLVVSTAEREDDLAALAHAVCPDHHPLESWGDAEPVDGWLSLSQPLLQPLGQTRSFLESLATWSGAPASAQELVQRHWREQVLPRSEERDFQSFWDQSLHDGVVVVEPGAAPESTFASSAVELLSAAAQPADWVLELFARVGLPESRHAHNPWLQELPDPITKTTWDNYVALSPAAAEELALVDGDVVRVSLPDGVAVELPAVIQPGQHDRVVAIPLGYGVRGTDRFSQIGPQWLEARPTVAVGERVGKNAAPLLALTADGVHYHRAGVQLAKTGRRVELATTQEHHRLEVPAHVAPPGAERREPIQETTLSAFAADPRAGAPEAHHETGPDLWRDDHPRTGHAWGMVIDLNACTGCAACVIACQAENNVPVVGRDEVQRQREMHWIRIDRYYSGAGDEVAVAQQPMMCQHCGNAPCETVCPVLATVHSDEGLNDQAYNRCVGTRYCANNCPYKVRRFNWFDYPRHDALQNLLLNPEVTVRTRGVMEKCSMCVQRIEEGKADAARRDGPVQDDAILTACQQSCPAQAIQFGDTNDPSSQVARALASPRRFGVLEEFNFKPVVSYLRMVRNRVETPGAPRPEQAHD